MRPTPTNPDPDVLPPPQPDWISPVPTPTPGVVFHRITSLPRPGETGLEGWLRDLTAALATVLDGPVQGMWLAECLTWATPWASFFAAEIAGHRIHLTGWATDPTDPASDTRHALAIDGLQLPDHPRTHPDLRTHITTQIAAAHQRLAHTTHAPTIERTQS